MPEYRPRKPRGFTLVELMIGILIGLLATLAVTQVMVGSEGYKRTTTSGSDAQVNGALALATLQRAIQSAGYGFSSSQLSLGCALRANFNGAPIASLLPNFPTTLAPVIITPGVPAGAPDTIEVISSGKTSYAVPLSVVTPGYTPGDTQFQMASVATVVSGDLMVALKNSPDLPCEMFRVTSNPATLAINRADDPAKWNMAGFPAVSYTTFDYLVNMGAMVHNTYVIGSESLRLTALNIAADSTPSYIGPTELFSNIVSLKAMYGKDTHNVGTVDVWDNVTPTNNTQWSQLRAIRLAVVARSTQYEKEDVTLASPQWDVGAVVPVAGAVACPSGVVRCVNLKVDTLPDWRHYRYKVFDTVIPLRNMLWNS